MVTVTGPELEEVKSIVQGVARTPPCAGQWFLTCGAITLWPPAAGVNPWEPPQPETNAAAIATARRPKRVRAEKWVAIRSISLFVDGLAPKSYHRPQGGGIMHLATCRQL
jgi:hypothetical protein